MAPTTFAQLLMSIRRMRDRIRAMSAAKRRCCVRRLPPKLHAFAKAPA